mgnify:FL=1
MATQQHEESIGADAPPCVRWRDSLYFRVIVLYVVLLLCLFGSAAMITRYFFIEAVREMEAQTNTIAESITLQFEETPDIDYGELEQRMMDLHRGFEIEIQPYSGEIGDASFTIEPRGGGRLTRVARVPLRSGDRHLLLTATVTIVPQVEILRAFTHRAVAALVGLFLLTLALMVYFIARALHPLSRLSATCAAISAGDLRPVSTRGATGEIFALEETFNRMVQSLQEKELVEAKLRQAQRLSALGNLAAGIAHDIRNPLNAIKLLASHALDMIGEDADRRAAKPLHTIRQEVHRLEGIVSSFLSLAKETELHLEPHRVDALLEECVQLFRQDAEERQLRLIAELRAGDTRLMIDAKHWKRAILNVLLNALEASPPGGRVRLFSRITDSACEVEIRDDGPGLAKEIADRVFDPYFTTKPGGTGLGMSITRGIIEEHGGSIEFTSAPGQGCQVLITMPLEKTKAP